MLLEKQETHIGDTLESSQAFASWHLQAHCGQQTGLVTSMVSYKSGVGHAQIRTLNATIMHVTDLQASSDAWCMPMPGLH